MQVLDHEPHSWFLFEADGALYLDANCSHGAVGYSFMVRLTAVETRRYRDEGRGYLNWLAQDIHNGAPILSASTSLYKSRKASEDEQVQASAALSAWQADRIRSLKLGG